MPVKGGGPEGSATVVGRRRRAGQAVVGWLVAEGGRSQGERERGQPDGRRGSEEYNMGVGRRQQQEGWLVVRDWFVVVRKQ